MELSRRRAALVRRLHRRRSREREGLFMVEGLRAAEEALDAGAAVRFAVRAPGVVDDDTGRRVVGRLEEAGVEVAVAGDDAFEELADTETPQGLLLVCAEPGWSLDALLPEGGGRPRLLVLDGVQDPGNAGTLVRSAAAFGLSGVVALDGTADPWGTRTVRASAGAIARCRVVGAPWERVGPWLAGSGVPLLAAEAGGEDVSTVRPGPAWALAVGNEGAGVRASVREAATAVVSVPMPGGAESLNAAVAASVLLYALTAQRPGGGPTPGGSDGRHRC